MAQNAENITSKENVIHKQKIGRLICPNQINQTQNSFCYVASLRLCIAVMLQWLYSDLVIWHIPIDCPLRPKNVLKENFFFSKLVLAAAYVT